MPYIKKSRREELIDSVCETPGELNYKLTTTIIDYMNFKGLNYQTINDIVGALEGCKLEFYRRVASPYENKKIEENGDVYDGKVD
jgi:hypothetical protein